MSQLLKVLLLSLVFMGGYVHASPLDDARAAGHIIEQADGYVKAAASAPAKSKALATQVNKRREAAYKKIAAKNGISAAQVGVESYKKRVGS